MNTYFDLLVNRKLDEAEEIRKNGIPSKLIKFISLDDNTELNESKFKTLEGEKIWFSSVDALNDPYEYQCMIINEQPLIEVKYPDWLINRFKTLLGEDARKWAVVSLSANSFDSLPMWAYYTNNYKGFCVEYDVVKPDVINKVRYEPDRIPIASTMASFYKEYQKMVESGETSNTEVNFYATLVKQQFFLKHKSWSHENEYRIIYPLQKSSGMSIPIAKVGLKRSRIIAGLNCKSEHIKELRRIATSLRCGEVKQVKISTNSYTLLEDV